MPFNFWTRHDPENLAAKVAAYEIMNVTTPQPEPAESQLNRSPLDERTRFWIAVVVWLVIGLPLIAAFGWIMSLFQ